VDYLKKKQWLMVVEDEDLGKCYMGAGSTFLEPIQTFLDRLSQA
jgi:hypothetical protein